MLAAPHALGSAHRAVRCRRRRAYHVKRDGRFWESETLRRGDTSTGAIRANRQRRLTAGRLISWTCKEVYKARGFYGRERKKKEVLRSNIIAIGIGENGEGITASFA